jgi:hypothetical protein
MMEEPKKKSPPPGPLRQAYEKFQGPPPVRHVDTFGNRYADSAATSTAAAGVAGASDTGYTSPRPLSPTRSMEPELEPYPPRRAGGHATIEALGGGFGSRFVEPTEPTRTVGGYATTSSLL